MRIGLIGDTHYPEAGPLWDEAYDAFAGVDLILHAGDLHTSTSSTGSKSAAACPCSVCAATAMTAAAAARYAPKTRA